MRKTSIASLVLVLVAGELSAQTLTISSTDPNMTLGGTYLGGVVNKPDVYGMYMTNAVRRFTWGADHLLHDTVTNYPGCKNNPGDPSQIDACGDQIGLFWKHISCNPMWYVPCDSNEHWNAAPGQDNITTARPVEGIWPPVNNFSHQINFHTVNAKFPVPPTSPWQQNCHKQNPNSLATAATSSRVAYEPSTGRWYMVFNANINKPIDQDTGNWTGDDTWRLLWAVSTDGGNTWNIDPSFMLRSYREDGISCGSGFQALDLLIKGTYFYVFFTEIEDKAVYLMRSLISTAQYGYTTWQIAGPPIGGVYDWSTTISTTGATVSNFGSVAYSIAPGYNNCYGAEQFAVSRVFNSSTPGSDSRTVAVSSADDPNLPPGQCHGLDGLPNNNALRLWMTPDADINKPFQQLGLIPTPGLQASSNGWYISYTHYQDNVSASPRVVGTGFDLWLSGSDAQDRQITYRTTAVLHGGIYP